MEGRFFDDDDDCTSDDNWIGRPRSYSGSSMSSGGSGCSSPATIIDHRDEDESSNKSFVDESDKIYPPECYCPISQSIMIDPVICADGHTYERKNIEKWLRDHSTSPNTNEVLPYKQLVPNLSLRNVIQLLTNQNKAKESTEGGLISISEI